MSKKKLQEGTYTRESVCEMLNDFYDCLSGKKALKAGSLVISTKVLSDDEMYKAAVREYVHTFESQAKYFGLSPRKHGRAMWVRNVLVELARPYRLVDMLDLDADVALAVFLGKKIRHSRMSPNIRNLKKVFGVRGVEIMLMYPYIS